MRIERRNYSSKPWRLVTDDGREVTTRERLAIDGTGSPTYDCPVCGATKTEVVDQALKLLDDFVHGHRMVLGNE